MDYIGVFQSKSGNQYIYDGCTNLIIPAEEKLLDVIENNQQLDKSLIYNNASYYTKKLLDKWDFFIIKNTNIDIDFIVDQLRIYPYPQLVLGLTENCNLRCKYCIFSGNYSNMRSHSSNKMNSNIAIESVDKFIHYINEWKEFAPEKEPVITFYGGEPLLEIELLKEVVAYVKSRDFNTMFTLTTNGLLLNNDIIKYLVDSNFLISVSLDGSKSIHDKKRVRIDGTGSFDTVYSNILSLKNEIKRQGKTEKLPIMILTCYDNETDMVELNDFFIKEKEHLYGLGGRTSEIISNGEEEDTRINMSMRKLYQEYLSSILKNDGESKSDNYFSERIFGSVLNYAYTRNVVPYGSDITKMIGNTCIPGSKIFVSTNGNFHICERMDQSFPIGNYKEGIDFDRVDNIMKEWANQFVSHCGGCPYTAICGICFAGCAKEGEFKIAEFCKDRKNAIQRQLGTLYTILETNPAAISSFTKNKDLYFERFSEYRVNLNNCTL